MISFYSNNVFKIVLSCHFHYLRYSIVSYYDISIPLTELYYNRFLTSFYKIFKSDYFEAYFGYASDSFLCTERSESSWWWTVTTFLRNHNHLNHNHLDHNHLDYPSTGFLHGMKRSGLFQVFLHKKNSELLPNLSSVTQVKELFVALTCETDYLNLLWMATP